jgi:hypothetical protein
VGEGFPKQVGIVKPNAQDFLGPYLYFWRHTNSLQKQAGRRNPASRERQFRRSVSRIGEIRAPERCPSQIATTDATGAGATT